MVPTAFHGGLSHGALVGLLPADLESCQGKHLERGDKEHTSQAKALHRCTYQRQSVHSGPAPRGVDCWVGDKGDMEVQATGGRPGGVLLGPPLLLPPSISSRVSGSCHSHQVGHTVDKVDDCTQKLH